MGAKDIASKKKPRKISPLRRCGGDIGFNFHSGFGGIHSDEIDLRHENFQVKSYNVRQKREVS